MFLFLHFPFLVPDMVHSDDFDVAVCMHFSMLAATVFKFKKGESGRDWLGVGGEGKDDVVVAERIYCMSLQQRTTHEAMHPFFVDV